MLLGLGLLAFGSSAILVRFASAAPGATLVVWRTAFVVLVLAPLAFARCRDEWRALGQRDWVLIGLSGSLLGVHFLAYVESLYLTSVASASVLVTLSPLFIAVLGFVVLGERLTRRTAAAVGAGVTGAAMIGLADAAEGAFANPALGNALALGAAFVVSVYLLIGRVVRQRVSFLAYFFPLNAFAAGVAALIALGRGAELAQPTPILLLCLAMALGPGLLGHGAFNYAVRFVPTAVLGLLTLAEPLLASALALVLFGEVPPPLALAGMGVVLASIATVFLRAPARRLPDQGRGRNRSVGSAANVRRPRRK
ncbi:MAG: DMT family transporter [Rubricoccaceae bacterium]